MAKPGQAGTIEVAALMAATDRNGRVDPLVYEAQRLILSHQRLGNVDAEALVRDLQRSPGFKNFGQDVFLQAIDARLSSPAEKLRFAQALDAANVTDGFFQRQFERVGGVFSGAYDHTKAAAQWVDRNVSGGMSAAQRWAQEIVNDPKANAAERAAATVASEFVGKAQLHYGASKGATGHVIDTLGGFVDLGKMGYRFTTDPNYRDTLIGAAKMYAAEVAADPSKPVDQVRGAAAAAFQKWEDGLKQARTEGREKEYLGGTAGAAGVEILATLVPVSKLGKFGKIAGAIDRVTPDIGSTLGDAQRAMRAGGAAGEGGEQLLRGIVRSARDQGNLDEVVKAARATDNVEGLLRSGSLSPKELAEIVKTDKAFFDGKVGFNEALGFSTNGLQGLGKLTSRQLGDIGEALQTYDLVKQGYTDIVAIKNRSGHGIDLVGRNPKGELEFYEIKTSAKGHAVKQRGDPEDFVSTRLERAIEARGHWDPKNTIPGLKDVAEKLRDEIRDPLTDKVNVKGKWVEMNLSTTPGTPNLHVDKTVTDWVKPTTTPARKASLLNNPENLDYGLYQQAYAGVREQDRKLGRVSDHFSEQLAAALTVEAKAAGMKDIRHVVFNQDGTRAFAVDTANIDAESRRNVHVDVASAGQQTLAASSEKVAQVNIAQSQQAQAAIPPREQDDPSRNSPRMA